MHALYECLGSTDLNAFFDWYYTTRISNSLKTEIWQHGFRLARRLSTSVVDFVSPPVCVLCNIDLATQQNLNSDENLNSGQTLSGNRTQIGDATQNGRTLFCASCEEKLKPLSGQHVCARCGAPAGPHLNVATGCVHCQRERFAFEKVFSLGVYSDAMRDACLKAKNSSGRLVALGLAESLCKHFGDQICEQNVDVVMPVPRHWSQKLISSYSSSETLAGFVSHCLKAPMWGHILQKKRRTASQSSLPPSKRRTNLRGVFRLGTLLFPMKTAFSPVKRTLEGATVLLVDDILTTGSTAHEVARVLKKSGVSRVVVAVVARGISSSSVSIN